MPMLKRMRIYRLVIFGASLGLTLSAVASVEDDFATMKALAEQNSADAQYRLGFKYYKGEGVGQNYLKAFEWYLKAATQGDAKAQYAMGLMYDNGTGIRQSKVLAKEWYAIACDNGNQDGCHHDQIMNPK